MTADVQSWGQELCSRLTSRCQASGSSTAKTRSTMGPLCRATSPEPDGYKPGCLNTPDPYAKACLTSGNPSKMYFICVGPLRMLFKQSLKAFPKQAAILGRKSFFASSDLELVGARPCVSLPPVSPQVPGDKAEQSSPRKEF